MTISPLPSDPGRTTPFTLEGAGRAGKVALVAVGLIGDDSLRTNHGIERFAIDDHVFRLLRDKRVYFALSELTEVSFELALRKIDEVAALLRNNGISIRQTKRLLLILRAVTAVRPSTATLFDRLLKKAKDALTARELRTVFQPLVEDLEEAGRLLEAASS